MIENKLKNERLKVFAEKASMSQREDKLMKDKRKKKEMSNGESDFKRRNMNQDQGMKHGQDSEKNGKENRGKDNKRKDNRRKDKNRIVENRKYEEDKGPEKAKGKKFKENGNTKDLESKYRTERLKKGGKSKYSDGTKGSSGRGTKNLQSRDSIKPEKPTVKRNTSACPVFLRCGGCQLLDMPYEKQLKMKQKKLEELLTPYCRVQPVIGMKDPYHYRNKVHAVFDHDKKGNPISGVYEANSHCVVPVESCLIEDQKADEIIGTIRGMLKSFKIKTYDEDTGYGLLRHVLIRRGFTTGEIMVVLVTSSPIFPSKNNFVRALREKHPEITTIIQNINGRDTSMVLGERENVLYGKGYIEDILCGFRFRISSKSFYQVNPVQTEVLYRKAIELAGLTGKETVIDAYCGIGTIGIVASRRAGKVVGVELNRDAVRDAAQNAKINDIKNVQFYCNDAGAFMSAMADNGESADVVFMDPPRSGSTEEFIQAVVKMKPEKVVYVSCGPDTLARDMAVFEKKGYKAKEAWGVDMFPGTEHVETAVLLVRKP